MEWDVIVSRLDRYIWALSYKFAPLLISMEPCDLHQEGLIKLYEVYMSAQYGNKSGSELDAIFRQIVRNTFLDMVKTAKNHRPINMELNLEAVSNSWGYDGFHEVFLKYYQDFLGTKVSPEAARLLDELLNPSPAVYHMFNIQRMRRTALKQQGRDVRVPTRITNALIGKVLGFHPSKTKALVAELQRVWRREMVFN
jgi:DNA-directed RNA polymerase specialized sigma24 family protein